MSAAVWGSVFVWKKHKWLGISLSASMRLLERLDGNVMVNPAVIKNIYRRVTLLDAATSRPMERGGKKRGGE